MAYVAQLQRGQPMLQDVIGPKSPGAHFRKDSSSGNSSASNSTTGSNSSSSNSAGAGKQEAVRNAAWVVSGFFIDIDFSLSSVELY